MQGMLAIPRDDGPSTPRRAPFQESPRKGSQNLRRASSASWAWARSGLRTRWSRCRRRAVGVTSPWSRANTCSAGSNLEPGSVAAGCGWSLEASVKQPLLRDSCCIIRAPSRLFAKVVEGNSDCQPRRQHCNWLGGQTRPRMPGGTRSAGDGVSSRSEVQTKQPAPKQAKNLVLEFFGREAYLSAAALDRRSDRDAPMEAARGDMLDRRCERVLHQMFVVESAEQSLAGSTGATTVPETLSRHRARSRNLCFDWCHLNFC